MGKSDEGQSRFWNSLAPPGDKAMRGEKPGRYRGRGGRRSARAGDACAEMPTHADAGAGVRENGKNRTHAPLSVGNLPLVVAGKRRAPLRFALGLGRAVRHSPRAVVARG
jgi:hypothetical protein